MFLQNIDIDAEGVEPGVTLASAGQFSSLAVTPTSNSPAEAVHGTRSPVELVHHAGAWLIAETLSSSQGVGPRRRDRAALRFSKNRMSTS